MFSVLAKMMKIDQEMIARVNMLRELTWLTQKANAIHSFCPWNEV